TKKGSELPRFQFVLDARLLFEAFIEICVCFHVSLLSCGDVGSPLKRSSGVKISLALWPLFLLLLLFVRLAFTAHRLDRQVQYHPRRQPEKPAQDRHAEDEQQQNPHPACAERLARLLSDQVDANSQSQNQSTEQADA